MALANYTDLIASINASGGWLHRDDLSAIAPDWVTLCETTINYGNGEDVSGLRTAAQETTANLTCTAGTQTVSLPSDYLEMRRVYITVSGVRRELYGRPVTPISMFDASIVSAIPETYFVTGSTLYLVPIPSSAYVITILYYAKVGPIATSNTNWLMTAAPMVYLAGTIAHGAPWLGARFDPSPWIASFKMGMKQVTANDQARFKNTQLRSEAANMTRGSYGNWATFVSGQ